MTTLSQITGTPLSGLNHIDALLAGAHPWNFVGRTTLAYSFALTPAAGLDATILDPSTQAGFSGVQQAYARAALAAITQVTGIRFAEVADPAAADIHFANARLLDGYTSQDMSSLTYTLAGDQVTAVKPQGWVFLESSFADNQTPAPGGWGWESLLHELGHVLGLKHPDEGAVTLPPGDAPGQDNSLTTIMSDHLIGAPRATFGPDDLAALQWLYGGDGLAGKLGVGGAGLSLVGTAGADTLTGGPGADRFDGAGGNDTITGGDGTDTAVFHGGRSQFQVQAQGSTVTVTGASGAVTLSGVERVLFDDLGLAFDTAGTAGQAYRLYQAAFDRAPDPGGFDYWMTVLDGGAALADVAQGFANSAEFSGKYAALDETQFVNQLYLNVLHRAGEQGGVDFWTGHLVAHHLTPAEVLAAFAESAENQAALIGTISQGMPYTPA